MPLITAADFADYRPFMEDVEEATRITPYIIEAERLDLIPLLSYPLYSKLALTLNTPPVAAYSAVTEYTQPLHISYGGNIYRFVSSTPQTGVTPGTDVNVWVLSLSATESLSYLNLFNNYEYRHTDVYYSHPGIKDVLKAFTYARFLNNQNVSVTAFGVVEKRSEFSDNVEEKTMARLIAQARSTAIAYFAETETYLNRHLEVYPDWKSTCIKKYLPSKISSIG